RLLQQKGVNFDEIDVSLAHGRRQEMVERAGGRSTVPQIFIDGQGIGGFDDLAALDRDGKLDPLLGLG
ncbi:MAG: glutaredoxin 3, partial [Thermoleophilia bacterium]|nr:glutaredoxin 3 [Thermoleophilia bacterium]